MAHPIVSVDPEQIGVSASSCWVDETFLYAENVNSKHNYASPVHFYGSSVEIACANLSRALHADNDVAVVSEEMSLQAASTNGVLEPRPREQDYVKRALDGRFHELSARDLSTDSVF